MNRESARKLILNVLSVSVALLIAGGLALSALKGTPASNALKEKYGGIFGQRSGSRGEETAASVTPQTEKPTQSAAPTFVTGIADIGHEHAIVLLAVGRAAASGNGRKGRCDVGSWSGLVEVAAGYDFSLGLRSDGTVLMAGEDPLVSKEAIALWRDVVHISANASSVIALDSAGRVFVEGGRTTSSKPNGIRYVLPDEIASRTDAVAVAAGKAHLAVLFADGTCAAFGSDIGNSCAVGSWRDVAAIAAGVNGTVGLTKDGRVLYTGVDNYGQSAFNGITGAAAVAYKGWHIVCLMEDGSAAAYGWSDNDRCAVEQWAGKSIVGIAASGWNSLAVFADGTVSLIGHKAIIGVIDTSAFMNVRTRPRD